MHIIRQNNNQTDMWLVLIRTKIVFKWIVGTGLGGERTCTTWIQEQGKNMCN